MLIPFARYFNIIMVTDFPVHILTITILFVCILIWGENSAPRYVVINGLGACITESTPRVCHIMKNISLKISSEEALILCSDSKPFSLHLKIGTFEPLIYISFLASTWYCLSNGFDFQAVLIAFFPFSL